MAMNDRPALMLVGANNGNLSLCQNTSKGRKCLHQLLLRGGWKFDIQIMNFVN